MARSLSVVFLLLLLSFPMASCLEAAEEEKSQTESTEEAIEDPYIREPLKIVTQDGREFDFEVEVADTQEKLARGFMFREELAANHGMIFVFPNPQPLSFWMRNTFLALDIIFIDEKGIILNIEKGIPLNEENVFSVGPAKAAIEMNMGTAKKHDIKAGDRVIFPDVF